MFTASDRHKLSQAGGGHATPFCPVKAPTKRFVQEGAFMGRTAEIVARCEANWFMLDRKPGENLLLAGIAAEQFLLRRLLVGIQHAVANGNTGVFEKPLRLQAARRSMIRSKFEDQRRYDSPAFEECCCTMNRCRDGIMIGMAPLVRMSENVLRMETLEQ